MASHGNAKNLETSGKLTRNLAARDGITRRVNQRNDMTYITDGNDNLVKVTTKVTTYDHYKRKTKARILIIDDLDFILEDLLAGKISEKEFGEKMKKILKAAK